MSRIDEKIIFEPTGFEYQNTKAKVVIKKETIWATQKAIAQLFGVGVPAISKHLTHIFDEGELEYPSK